MLETYAKIVGRHTAGLLSRVTNGGRFRVRLYDLLRERPVCELAARIDFEGVMANGRKVVEGYMVCGAIKFVDILPLLSDIAVHLGLEASIVDTEDGPQNLLNEFLNIVIGLTGADWAEHGFEMNFSIPQTLSGQALPPFNPREHAFHLVVVSAATGLHVDILVVFNDCGQPMT
jgi:hypothetical protein